MIKTAILGGSGYTALELLKIFLRHQQIELVAVTSRREDSVDLEQTHPALKNRFHIKMEPYNSDRLLSLGVQCVFSCLPHGASMSVLPILLDRGMRVIDLSADYRLKDPNTYAQWYGESHLDLVHLTQAVYGLPEVFSRDISRAQLVANPGCYPQTAILGLLPLLHGKFIDPTSIIVDSKSGISGAGRTPKLNTHFPECNESVSAYSLGNHRHTPEIEQVLKEASGELVEILFTPHLIPMDRGIFSTIYAQPKRAISQNELQDLFEAYYDQFSFVRVISQLPTTKQT
ncbi:MAG: N-acetyl-gamma-glutamyl-phosphate reductase, partial [Gemmataceae bacterium]